MILVGFGGEPAQFIPFFVHGARVVMRGVSFCFVCLFVFVFLGRVANCHRLFLRRVSEDHARPSTNSVGQLKERFSKRLLVGCLIPTR